VDTYLKFFHTLSVVDCGHPVLHREHWVRIPVLPMCEPACFCWLLCWHPRSVSSDLQGWIRQVGHLCIARNLGMLHPDSCIVANNPTPVWQGTILLADCHGLEILHSRHYRLLKCVLICFLWNCWFSKEKGPDNHQRFSFPRISFAMTWYC
jgi:hypothetical protein